MQYHFQVDPCPIDGGFVKKAFAERPTGRPAKARHTPIPAGFTGKSTR
jgi:hypothetical protein